MIREKERGDLILMKKREIFFKELVPKSNKRVGFDLMILEFR